VSVKEPNVFAEIFLETKYRSDITDHHLPSEFLPKPTHIDRLHFFNLLFLALISHHQAYEAYKKKVANCKKVEEKCAKKV
jgi:hypothetical protein